MKTMGGLNNFALVVTLLVESIPGILFWALFVEQACNIGVACIGYMVMFAWILIATPIVMGITIIVVMVATAVSTRRVSVFQLCVLLVYVAAVSYMFLWSSLAR